MVAVYVQWYAEKNYFHRTEQRRLLRTNHL